MNEYLPSINNNPILLSFQEKQIIGYPGYTININGIVKKNGTEIKQYDNSRGYLSVCLKNGSKKSYRVHRLVASHFLKNPFDLPVVDHKNGNKYDNRLCNLEFVSHKENTNRFLNTNKRETKPVVRISIKTGKVKDVFMSIKKASEFFKYDYRSLYEAVKQKKVYKRYLWKFCQLDIKIDL